MGESHDDREESLDWIPRSVREKLDRAAIRLHLVDWQRLSIGERRELVRLPCDTAAEVAAFRVRLGRMVPGR